MDYDVEAMTTFEKNEGQEIIFRILDSHRAKMENNFGKLENKTRFREIPKPG